eukprot:gene120-70_t
MYYRYVLPPPPEMDVAEPLTGAAAAFIISIPTLLPSLSLRGVADGPLPSGVQCRVQQQQQQERELSGPVFPRPLWGTSIHIYLWVHTYTSIPFRNTCFQNDSFHIPLPCFVSHLYRISVIMSRDPGLPFANSRMFSFFHPFRYPPHPTRCHAAQVASGPDELFGELFTEVQLKRIFPDNKTFVDCTPKQPPAKIMEAYAAAKGKADFSLAAFVKEHFEEPGSIGEDFKSDTTRDVTQHIEALWDVLKRPPTTGAEGGSLLPAPYPFIVPGRFRETYYWDTYFTMLGLQVSNKLDVIENLLKNFDHTIKTYGHIPNGCRTYYLSRAQPPFYAMMVELLAESKGKEVYKMFVESMQLEHDYWMDKTAATQHVVKLDDGASLTRYWDQLDKPRQESYYEDYTLVNGRPDAGRVYRDLRSGAESGWDFSSRWFTDPNDLGTIRTTDLLQVDLNCLMYHLEKTLSVAYGVSGNAAKSEEYKKVAEARSAAIVKHFFNAEDGWYYDYVISAKKLSTAKSIAGIAPFFVGIAPASQADGAAKMVEEVYLRGGGVVTTPNHSGQQWDAPNGWAPLQWMTVKGLDDYGKKDLAKKIAQRWIDVNTKVYKTTGKLLEKYNVEDLSLIAGGGEYPAQDGFGWTNGVLLRMIRDYKD